MKYILIFLAVIFPQVITLNSVQATFEELSTCLINSGVSNETIFARNSTPEEYNKLNSQWNSRHGTIYPLAFLVPEDTADIQKAVICGKSLNIRVIPKSGGHNFEKYTYGDSQTLVTDLRKFNYVNVDEERQVAIVGAGTRQGKLGYDLWDQGGYTTAYGVCPSVGIAGYTLGGGKAVFSRKHGLMLDQVVEMEMVDAEGRLLIVNSEVNPDLFWALRGAGAVSFGIVTQFTIRVYEAPTEVFTYFLNYDMANFTSLVASYQRYSASNLTNTYGTLRLRATYIQLRFDELRYENEEHEYDRLVSLFLPAPTYNVTNKTTDYVNFFMERAMESYGSFVLPNVEVTHPENLTLIEDGIGQSYYHRKSFQLSKDMTTAEIENLFQVYIALLPSQAWLEEFGGKMQEYRSEESSFVHRNDVFNFAIAYEANETDPGWNNRSRTFMAATQALLGHTTTYQNYVDDEIENPLERYYGSNLQRLKEIKRKYDPENFFYTPQSIPVEPDSGDGNSSANVLLRNSIYYYTLIASIILKQIFW